MIAHIQSEPHLSLMLFRQTLYQISAVQVHNFQFESQLEEYTVSVELFGSSYGDQFSNVSLSFSNQFLPNFEVDFAPQRYAFDLPSNISWENASFKLNFNNDQYFDCMSNADYAFDINIFVNAIIAEGVSLNVSALLFHPTDDPNDSNTS